MATAYDNFKAQLRAEGVTVNILAHAERDAGSRFEELAFYAPGRPHKTAIATIYSDGSYQLHHPSPSIKIADDVAAVLVD